MQLELPPASDLTPTLIWLGALACLAALTWAFGLLAGDPRHTRIAPAWVWAVLLVVAPFVAVPVFLVAGAPPIPPRIWKLVGLACAVAVVVTVGVGGLQQIGRLDCRMTGDNGRDLQVSVCEKEARNELLPAGIGAAAGVAAGALAGRRRDPRDVVPQASAT